jgi:RHS repeat-associated protein
VYGQGRIGIYLRTGSYNVTNYVYELSDYLGNVRATFRNNAGNAEVLSYSDYYPHGSTLPGRNYISASAYKYAYQGQEVDNETGFLNFELRQYDARIGRWFNPDPMGQYYSPYLAMGNNPVSVIDPTGGWGLKWQDGGSEGPGTYQYSHHSWGYEDYGFFSSEFDGDYQGLYDGGGSHNADGTRTSNAEWSYGALELYFKNNQIEGKTGSTVDSYTYSQAYKVANGNKDATIKFAGQVDIISKWQSSFDKNGLANTLGVGKRKPRGEMRGGTPSSWPKELTTFPGSGGRRINYAGGAEAMAAGVMMLMPMMEHMGGASFESEVASTENSAVQEEMTVYRVFGGESRAQGFSWTPVNPNTVSNFRNAAGLPNGNTASFLLEGTVNPQSIINSRPALPLDGNAGGFLNI